MRHPYTEALLRSIPRVEDPSHTRLRVISGRPPDLTDPPPGCTFAPAARTSRSAAAPRCPLEVTGLDGHRFACFSPLGTPENAAALEHNLAAGLPQAVALLDALGDGDIDLSDLLAAAVNEAADVRRGGGHRRRAVDARRWGTDE